MNPLFAGILLGTLLGAALGKEAPGAPVTEAHRPVPATPRASGPAPLLSHQETACGAMTAVEAPAAPAKKR